MPFIIEDGLGSGQAAGVTPEGRLRVSARSFTLLEDESINGNGFSFQTGIITLTSASESGVFILQSTDTSNVIVFQEIIVSFGKSTGGSGNDVIYRSYYNPTGGTLLTAKSPIAGVANRNMGLAIPIVANVFQGTEGSTISGGVNAFTRLYVDQSREVFVSQGPVLTNGSAFAVSVQPGAGNTSMKFALTAQVVVLNRNEL